MMSDRSVLLSNDAPAVRAALEALLTQCQGNVTLASRRAGIERQSMHRLLKRHGLRASDFRPRGGGSIIARAALKNLEQLTARPRQVAHVIACEAPATHAAPVAGHTAPVGQAAPAAPAVGSAEVRRPSRFVSLSSLPPPEPRPITASELADRAFDARRGRPHHRPYQAPLGAAALHALGARKTG